MNKNQGDGSKLLAISTSLPSSIHDGEFTKTAQFLLPTIDLSLRITTLRAHLVNVFLDDENFEHDFSHPLFVLVKTKDYFQPSWIDVTKLVYDNAHFKLEYYAGEEDGFHLIMYIFEIPEKYHHEHQCFLQGKYSKMSKEYKALFPKTVSLSSSGTASESIIWGALYKSENLKQKVKKLFELDDATADSMEEYYDLPNMEREIFNHSTKKDEPKKE